jgi:hypothetical protein
MTRKEKLKILDETVRLYKELDDACDAFAELTGATYDKGLFDKVWRCVEYHRRHTAALIGDTNEWIDWYIYENDCGAKAHKAGRTNKMRKIRTTRDLLRLIEDCK